MIIKNGDMEIIFELGISFTTAELKALLVSIKNMRDRDDDLKISADIKSAERKINAVLED